MEVDDRCTMCNKHVPFVCPSLLTIRPFLADEEEMEEAPEGFIVERNARRRRRKIPYPSFSGRLYGLWSVCRGLSRKRKALVMKPYEEQKEKKSCELGFCNDIKTKSKSSQKEKNTVFVYTIQSTAA